MSSTQPPVRYCKQPPRTLRHWIDKHPEKVPEFDCGKGYTTDGINSDGFVYDILLRPGWRMSDDYVHTLIEPTVAAMLSQLRGVRPCDCSSCSDELEAQAQRSNPEKAGK